jgi:cobaltochelatase CobS
MTTSTTKSTSTTLNVVSDNTAIDYNSLELVDAHTVFPDVFAIGEIKVKRRVHRHPDCILSNPMYVPDERVLRRSLAWFHSPQRQALGLHGETGTGKSDMALYIADKLNEPVYIVKVNSSMMPEHLEGGKELTVENGVSVTRDRFGPAVKAYLNGGLLLLDEVDKANEALQASMHGLVEGKPWPVEQFSLTITKHSMCRVIGTANTTGEGGHERYITSQKMDDAFRSRFGWLEVKYPTPAVELEIMKRHYKHLPNSLMVNMVKLGTSIREVVYAPDNDVKAVFSTRTLVNWGHYMMTFGLKAQGRESLDFVFDGSVDTDSKEAVNDITQRIFDNQLDLEVKDLLNQYQSAKKS